MKLTSWRGVTVNNGTGPNVGLDNGSDRSYESDVALMTVPQRPSRLISASPTPRNLGFAIWPRDNTTDPHFASHEAEIQYLFRTGDVPGTLVAERIPGNSATLMSCEAIVTRLRPDPNNRQQFNGTFQVLDGYWREVALTDVSATPFTVLGSAKARPIVTVTSTATGIRQRVTVHSRNQGEIGWLCAIVWTAAASETWVWINGVPMPFDVSGGFLWFRSDVQAGADTMVDVYHIVGSDNPLATQFDRAGTQLTAGLAARTSVVADLTTAGRNAVSASLTWQPGISAAHHDGTPYTFGLTAEDTVALKDRTQTGERVQLADDADSLIFTSPAEMSGIGSFTVGVRSGIRPADADDSDADDFSRSINEQPDRPAYLKVRVGVGGFAPATLTWRTHTFPDAVSPDPVNPGSFEQWNSGQNPDDYATAYQTESDFQGRFTYGGSEGSIYARETETIGPEWSEEFQDNIFYKDVYTYLTSGSVATGIENAADGAGVTLTDTAGGWTYLVTFAGYAGVALPFLGFSHTGARAILVDQAWVDVNGNVITSQASDTPKNGRVRVVLRYRVRDDESWYTAWSQVVSGTILADEQEITVPARSFPSGAVQVAIGLESVANGETSIDWGELRAITNPELTFQSGATPIVEVSDDIDAMLLDGSVAFDTNGDGVANYRITFDAMFADAGIEIDCDVADVRGADGIGPVYGEPRWTDPNVWVALDRGENAFTTTGTIDTVALSYQERWGA